jgi:hypothetical protein
MIHIGKSLTGTAVNPVTLSGPVRRSQNAAVALSAIADAEWSAARYPHFDVVPISLATALTACLAQSRRRVPEGLDPGLPLMGPHPTD